MLSLAALASLPLAAVLSAAPLAAPPAVQADGVGSLVSVSVRVDGGDVARTAGISPPLRDPITRLHSRIARRSGWASF